MMKALYLSGCILAAVAGLEMGSLTVAAQDILIDIDFEDGTVGQFMTYTNGGEFGLLNENGELVCDIQNCGSLDYANQAYYDGFALTEGCVYRFGFDVYCDIERQMEYRMQLNGGDYHAYQSELVSVGPELQRIEAEFTMAEATDPAPRLAFNMGYESDMTADPGAHKICIDNIQLVMLDDSNAAASESADQTVQLCVNQMGYQPEDSKQIIASGELSGTEFKVCHIDDDKTVFTGTFGAAVYNESTDSEICRGDFSEVQENGYYKIIATLNGENVESPGFSVSEMVYDELFSDALQMLTLQRCAEITEEYAGVFAHPACHTTPAEIYVTGEQKEVSGGWHDAGDYGRYVVSGAKAVADLLEAFEMNQDNSTVCGDQLWVLESENGVPDLLDEARFELEWMLKMQDEASGGVYHKVSCRNFPGTVMPQDETEPLVLAPISATATGDFAAVMAKAAVIYQDTDPEFAVKCLDAAVQAWNYLGTSNSLVGFRNPDEIVTGEYPDTNLEDEFFWAAVELYIAKDKGMLRDTQELMLSPELMIEEKLYQGLSPLLGWADVAGYGLYDLAKYAEQSEFSDGQVAECAASAKEQMLAQADALSEISLADGYFCTLGMDYPWGSNMTVANNGLFLLMANDLLESDSYQNAAKAQLDYLLGANGTGYSFVTCYGTKIPEHPHHRPSQSVGHPMDAMLVGGPNKNLEDPYAAQVLSGKAPALCYVDNEQSYSVNEVAIYWNSPLIALLAEYVSC